MEKTLKVRGMHCNSCKLLIEDSVSEITGVQSIVANFETGVVKVKYADEKLMPKIKQAIKKEGYNVK